MNHSPKPNVHWWVDEEDQTVRIEASAVIRSNEEILTDYGASASSQKNRVNIYGFTFERNIDEEDFVEFSVKELEVACQHVSKNPVSKHNQWNILSVGYAVVGG